MNAEKMRSSVLAYCEEVCPNKSGPAPIDCGHLAFGCVEDDGVQMEAWMLFIGEDSPTITLYVLSSEDSWLAAYRLLGLETRDAVAECERLYLAKFDAIQQSRDIEREMASATLKDLKAERARNAALVAALEKIKEEHGYRYTYGDGFGNVTEKRLSSLGVAIDLLIAANTEKGGANG